MFSFKCSALVELVKHKPKVTEEQLKTVMGDFAAFVDKCCAADDKEACFALEVLELFAFIFTCLISFAVAFDQARG